MTSVGGEHRVFAANIEDLTVNVGGKVVLAAVAAVGRIKHRPGGVGGFVGSQVHGRKHPLYFMRLGVNPLIGFPNRRIRFGANGSTSITKATGEKH